MRIPLYQVDAFAAELFRGNPAAVMPLERFLPDKTLLAIAAENNLSETAFLVKDGMDYRLRWFTPAAEVPLCGHATLASAAVVLERLEAERDAVAFHTLSGLLTVKRAKDGYEMDFPAQGCRRCEAFDGVAEALRENPAEVWRNERFTLVLLEEAKAVRTLRPDFARLAQLDPHGVIVTAAGEDGYDCVSRFFAPNLGIHEDPVTGSAHCVLAPFWSRRLGKKRIRACQASARGGELLCNWADDRIELQGKCYFYLEGVATIPD